MFEIERKFLIEYPDVGLFESKYSAVKSEIVQTYLESKEGEEIRVRLRVRGGERSFVKTLKKKLTDVKRFESEEAITEEEYLLLLDSADKTKVPIHKTRYVFDFKGLCFEVDIYPFWNDKAIVEIELEREDTPVSFPEEIKIIKEVTADERFKNSSLAKTGGIEDKK